VTEAEKQTLATLFLIVAVGSACFWAGWDLAVRRFKKRQADIAKGYEELAAQFEEVSKFYDQEPARAGINTGVVYMIGQMQAFLDTIKERYEIDETG
jgi:hypothetical protein